MQFHLSPIGYVRADAEGFRLEIQEPYRPALQGIEGFSHLLVIWWCHLVDVESYRSITRCDKPYRKAAATMGVFATRSPVRPNPIAISPVPVMGIDEDHGMIYIPYIDAEDATPIVDLKPYHPCIDRIKDVQVPAWCSHWPQSYEESASFDWSAEFVHAQ